MSEIERERERRLRGRGMGGGEKKGLGRCEREGVRVSGNCLKDNFIFPLPFSKMVVSIAVGGSGNSSS